MYYLEDTEEPEDDEGLETTLSEIENYVNSENKDSTGRFIRIAFLERVFRYALNSPQKMYRVYRVLSKMSQHPDDALRLVLMEDLPKLALRCFGKERLDFVNTHLWPLLLACLPDKNSMVRSRSEESLLFLIKGKLLYQDTVEKKVCPAVVGNTELEDCVTVAVSVGLMGKLAPLIGKEATEKHFLERFMLLCSNEKCLVRQFCAQILGDMCAAVGVETTEEFLLPLFVQLCRDKDVTPRFACARGFVSVSCACSLAARKTVLAPAFTHLLMDRYTCVQSAAYVALGPFICTFADPSIIKPEYKEDGEMIFVNQEGCEFRIRSVYHDTPLIVNECEDWPFSESENDSHDSDPSLNLSYALRFIVKNSSRLHFPNQRFLMKEKPLAEISWATHDGGGGNRTAADKEADELYNGFRFWRMPVPLLDSFESEPEQEEIKADLNILDKELSSLSEKLKNCSTTDLTESVISSPDSGWNSAEATPHVDSVRSPDPKPPTHALPRTETPTEGADGTLPPQEIVPQVLLDYFVCPEMLENGIAQDCAYCLPAVVLTLGPSNWPRIKFAFICLSMNIQWRVRKKVVSSIHILASILGEEIASKDLAPIFECFIRDLDEVKIRAIERLADFLKCVNPATRNAFLPRLKDLLETDFDWNWRYRMEFVEQLRLLINLFSPADWLQHFEPLATLLLCDKVAAVRQKAALLFLELLINLKKEPEMQMKLLYILLRGFAEHGSWRRRQVFVLVCSEIAREKAVDSEDFSSTLLAHLHRLSEDAVPNVTLCVARCLSSDIVSSGYISPSSPHFSAVMEILEKLKNHEDSDIRYFASLHEECKDANNDLNAPFNETLQARS